jgi:CRISPR-associated endoribonuclease Cas6
MLLSAVVTLQAIETGAFQADTGRVVHGLWFHHWKSVNPTIADRLHGSGGAQPFTLSPLMDLPQPHHNRISVKSGERAWFRVTALTKELAVLLDEEWLAGLPSELTLGGLGWQVTRIATEGHPWAARADMQSLAEARLLASRPPDRWKLHFATPTAFHGEAGHFPFPLPNVLVGSWLRRWREFGPVELPDDLPERIRRGMVVSAYELKTLPLRDRRRVMIGSVGQMTMQALKLSPGERAAVDLLVSYAFWAGSGHRTTQGMGMTRLLPKQ